MNKLSDIITYTALIALFIIVPLYFVYKIITN